MTGSNTTLLLGVVAEPLEELTTKTGKPWIKLVLEISTWRRTSESGGQDETTLVPVNCFSKVAEIVREYLKAGDAVALTVRVSGTEYKGSDGRTRRGVTLTADQLHLLSNGRAAKMRETSKGEFHL
jgi:single-stranded DNA-binding protein